MEYQHSYSANCGFVGVYHDFWRELNFDHPTAAYAKGFKQCWKCGDVRRSVRLPFWDMDKVNAGGTIE